MKTTIKVITLLNRLCVVVFVSSLLISIIIKEILMFGLWFAFFLGIFQVISSYISLLFLSKMDSKSKKNMLAYIIMVPCFFLCWYFIDSSELINNNPFFNYFIFTIPILLALFFTYTLEIIYKNR